jgi:hypothetical protein
MEYVKWQIQIGKATCRHFSSKKEKPKMLEGDKNPTEALIFGGTMGAISLLFIMILMAVTPEFYQNYPIVIVLVSIIAAYLISSLAYKQKV